MKTLLRLCALVAASVLTLSSCKQDPDEGTNIQQTFVGGVFVMCEGNYNDANASVSYYNKGVVANHLFSGINGRPLGDQGQSITIHDGKAYLLVQHSGKIEVVDATTFVSIATIDERITSPRYMVVYNGFGYVSDWYADYIKIINLSTNTVTDSIAVDERPEQLLIKGTTLYVSNTGIYPDQGSKVSIIDLTTNTKTGNITVSANPAGMQLDANGDLWVLCGGDAWATVPISSSMVQINTTTNTVSNSYTFTNTVDYPYLLKKNSASDVLYYTASGQLYKFSTTTPVESSTPFLTRSFYSFAVDPTNDDVYGTISPNFTSNGKIVRYNAAGVKQDSATLTIAPGHIVFK